MEGRNQVALFILFGFFVLNEIYKHNKMNEMKEELEKLRF